MIAGTVNAYREAVIQLHALDAAGTAHEVEAVIDTGFNGSLTLPAAEIASLGLPWRTRTTVTLGNGSEDECDVYAGTVIWDGQPRGILVEAAETNPLVGMNLMLGYELNVQVSDGGSVRLTQM